MSIESTAYPAKSPLIAAELEGQLLQLFQKLDRPVQLVCLLGQDEKSTGMAAFLNHITTLSPQLSCRFLAPGEDTALDERLDASLLPATGIFAGEEFTRAVFHGIPGGKEITGFAAAILNAGGAAKPLDRPTLRDIAAIRQPLTLHVCVSLGCQHCAQLVMHAQRIALENPLVTAHMVDANLYPALVQQHSI